MTDWLLSGELWAPSQAQVSSSLHREGPVWALVPSSGSPPAGGPRKAPRERSGLHHLPGSQLDTQQQGHHGHRAMVSRPTKNRAAAGSRRDAGGGRPCDRRHVHTAEARPPVSGRDGRNLSAHHAVRRVTGRALPSHGLPRRRAPGPNTGGPALSDGHWVVRIA